MIVSSIFPLFSWIKKKIYSKRGGVTRQNLCGDDQVSKKICARVCMHIYIYIYVFT